MAQAQKKNGSAASKGAAFFKRADEVAATGNWDFAIEMYLEGIAREPENVERGHQPLRDVSLKRKAQGGKSPGMMEQLKRRPGKDPMTNLINAEYLLAKEPGSVGHMERVLQSAEKLELDGVVVWIGEIILDAQRQSDKPNRRVCELVTEAMSQREQYVKAIQACELAVRAAPNDGNLAQKLKDLSARYTIQKGRYDGEGDFTRSVKDLGKQAKLVQKDRLAQSRSYLEQEIDRARQEYQAEPSVPGKISALVDALMKVEEEGYENEAVDVLNKAHRDTGAYQFKARIGDIRIRQMKRQYRKLLEAHDKAGAMEQAKSQLAFELQEYSERAENYPTDLAIKFELGRRQFLAGRYDDAIGSLQQAHRDPRRRLTALNLLGQAWAKKGLPQEAIDTYRRALESEMTEEQEKDLRYNLGTLYAETRDYAEAREEFSRVAQMDYSYRDVRDRLAAVDERIQEAGGDEGPKEGGS